MYEMVIVNQFGKVSVIKSYNLEELKKVAQRLNSNGCDVEIIEKKVIYRIDFCIFMCYNKIQWEIILRKNSYELL